MCDKNLKIVLISSIEIEVNLVVRFGLITWKNSFAVIPAYINIEAATMREKRMHRKQPKLFCQSNQQLEERRKLLIRDTFTITMFKI